MRDKNPDGGYVQDVFWCPNCCRMQPIEQTTGGTWFCGFCGEEDF